MITFNGQQYSGNVTMLHYYVGHYDVASMEKVLDDRGANGGICVDDMRVLEGSERFVDVSGLGSHKVRQLSIATAHALVSTHNEILLPCSIKWNCLVRVKVFCCVSKWKRLVLTLMMELNRYLV
jgi:hypothetical protein